jgi:uncharacterized protein YjeT (DUF2065 family)
MSETLDKEAYHAKMMRELKTTALGLAIALALVLGGLYLKGEIPEQWKQISSVIQIAGPVSVILMFITGKWKPAGPLAIIICVLLWFLPWSFYIASRIVERKRNVQTNP